MKKANGDFNSEFRARLQDEFARRVRVNARYSVRSFANHLEIDSSTLSQVLSGKRNLSDEKIAALCKRLGIQAPNEKHATGDYSTIALDKFSVIGDWYHFAILDLTLIHKFKSDPAWIARKLGLKQIEVIAAIERMKRLELLVEKDGRLMKGQPFYTNFSDGVTSAALKEYQRQILTKALHAIDNTPAERKDITSMTIAVNSKKLKQAKDKIKKFRRELCEFLETGEKDAVYHLGVQLYSVTCLDN